MIELTEQEKEAILGIAARTSLDVDGDMMNLYVNVIRKEVSVIERVQISKEEYDYMTHDRQVTMKLFKTRPWKMRMRDILRRTFK